ncbi:MAG: DUF1232 domain-containing protein [Armatimonadetes bacterium]|nr:DUF1232 domain-containing protein [Armatimonadota bacterium]
MSFFGSRPGMNRKFSQFHYLMHAPNFIRLFLRLYGDRRVWFLPKLILGIGVLYALWPLDAIPGFPLVGLGYLDDILVLYLTAKLFIRLCPPNVVQEHVQLIDQGA